MGLLKIASRIRISVARNLILRRQVPTLDKPTSGKLVIATSDNFASALRDDTDTDWLTVVHVLVHGGCYPV